MVDLYPIGCFNNTYGKHIYQYLDVERSIFQVEFNYML